MGIRRRWTTIGTALALTVGASALAPAATAAPSSGAVPGGTTRELQVGGAGGVPGDATAVVLNVTATDAAGDGYLTLWPCGQARPVASNLNFVADGTIANLVVAKLGTGGKVCIYAHATTDVVADVAGYFPAGSGYTPVANPVRLVDTRTGFGVVQAGTTLELTVGGVAGVPADATAAVLNVTAADPEGEGFLTVFPCGQTQPTASNLNFQPRVSIPNLVLTRLGTAGKVCIYAHGTTHLVVDVAGYLPAGAGYTPIANPVRLVDTRTAGGLVAAGGTLEVTVGGAAIPADAAAAVLNVTAAEPVGAGFLTVWPCGQARPLASNLNYAARVSIPNLVLTRLGTAGKVCIYAHGATHVVVDAAGSFPAGAGYTPVPNPVRILDTRVGAKTTPTITALTTAVSYPGAPIPLAPLFAVTPPAPLTFAAVDRDVRAGGPYCSVDGNGNLVLKAAGLNLDHTCTITATASPTASTNAAQRIVDLTVERQTVTVALVGTVAVSAIDGGVRHVTFRVRFDPPVIANVQEGSRSTCPGGGNAFTAALDPARPGTGEWIVTVDVPDANLPCSVDVENTFQDQLLGIGRVLVGISRPA